MTWPCRYLPLLVCSLILGCSEKSSNITKYGVAHNLERKKRGIPVLDPAWTAQDMGGFLDYFDPHPKEGVPHRLSKRIFLDKRGAILKEIDSFYSGQTFISKPPEQTRLSQVMIMQYQYFPANGETNWEIDASLNPDEFSKSLTLQEADRLLNSWGLIR